MMSKRQQKSLIKTFQRSHFSSFLDCTYQCITFETTNYINNVMDLLCSFILIFTYMINSNKVLKYEYVFSSICQVFKIHPKLSRNIVVLIYFTFMFLLSKTVAALAFSLDHGFVWMGRIQLDRLTLGSHSSLSLLAQLLPTRP